MLKIGNYELTIINTPCDGHCLFHSLLLAFFTSYIDEEFDRLSIVKKLREELSQKLGSLVPGSKTVRYYDLLYNSNINDFSKNVDEFTLVNMQKAFNSDDWIGYGYLEFICNHINKDLYIIDGNTMTLYKGDETPLLIKNRLSIILYYKNNHYQLVGLKTNQGIATHFKPTNELIVHLKSLL